MTSRFTAGVGCRLQCTVLQLLHAYYCQDRGIGGRCKTRAANDPSLFSITEKRQSRRMLSCSFAALVLLPGPGYGRTLQDKAGGDTRPLPPGRDIRSIIHRFTFVLIVSVISQVDTDFTDGRGTTLCNTQANCINTTTIFSPFQCFFIILSGK